MSNSTSFAKRLAIFIVGIPGYILTLFPWMFVLALAFMALVRYTADGDISLDYIELQYESLEVTAAQVLMWVLLSLGLWMFMAWFIKRMLLTISKKFGDSEKTWQITKITALISGWVAVALVATFVFENLTRDFVFSELLVTGIGLISFGLEYGLTRLFIPTKR